MLYWKWCQLFWFLLNILCVHAISIVHWLSILFFFYYFHAAACSPLWFSDRKKQLCLWYSIAWFSWNHCKKPSGAWKWVNFSTIIILYLHNNNSHIITRVCIGEGVKQLSVCLLSVCQFVCPVKNCEIWIQTARVKRSLKLTVAYIEIVKWHNVRLKVDRYLYKVVIWFP